MTDDFDFEIDETPAQPAPKPDTGTTVSISADADFLVPDEIDIEEESAKPAPKQQMAMPIVIDLANVAPEKREITLANAEIAGIKVLNAHLIEESQKNRGDRRALLMEFPENPPPEVTGMQPLFRMSKKDDLDILFVGLPVGPVFQDQIESHVKAKYRIEHSPEQIATKHFVVYVYMAIALPFGENEKMNSGWGLTPFCPKEVERIMPKALRTHLGIDLWYRTSGSRFDAIWYRVEEVFSDDAKEDAIKSAKLIAALGWALLTTGAPHPEIPSQVVKKWEDEYYAKNPDKRPKAADGGSVTQLRGAVAGKAVAPSAASVAVPVKELF